ncbi:MAG: hypothetical protein AB7V56_12590 [Candidatus Nitrosocosmicus sp.]
MTLGRTTDEVLEEMQKNFKQSFIKVGKLKESEINPINFEIKQAWTRIRKHIKKYPD